MNSPVSKPKEEKRKCLCDSYENVQSLHETEKCNSINKYTP